MKIMITVLLTFFCLPSLAGKILLIESYHSEYPWDKEYIQGIEGQIGTSHHFDTFQMNTKRIPQEQFASMAEKAWSYYQQTKPEVVILGDDNALKYMLPKLYDEPISIVFLGINSNPRSILSKYKGQAQVTGILERPLLLKNMKVIAELMSLKKGKVLVLFDSGTTSEIANAFITKQFGAAQTHLNIKIDAYNIGTINEWKSIVSGAKNKGYDAIMIGLYHTLIDEKNNNVDANSVLSWTNKQSPIPLFGFWDFSVGKGKTIGGVVLFGESQGAAAGGITRQILEGKPVSSIPITTGKKGKAIYSEYEAARWNLTPPVNWSNTD